MVTLYRYLTNLVFAGKCTVQHTLFITLSEPTNRAIQSTSNKSFLCTVVLVRCSLLYAVCKPVADIKGQSVPHVPLGRKVLGKSSGPRATYAIFSLKSNM